MATLDARDDIDRPLNGEILVRDVGGVAISDGEILAVVSTIGPRMQVAKADADTATLRDSILLIAQGNSAALGLIAVHAWRLLQNVNTLGATAGDPVYLSNTAGAWSLSPGTVTVQVGVVTVVSATVGAILLAPGALRVSSTSLLGTAMIDNAVVRGDGVGRIQSSLWTLDDLGLATVPTNKGLYSAGSLILTGDTQVRLVSGTVLLAVSPTRLAVVTVDGWTVESVAHSRAGIIALFGISDITPTDGVFPVANGTGWVGESGATARSSLGIGAPEEAIKTAAQTVTTEATVTWTTVTLDSAEITKTSDEFIVQAGFGGVWEIEWSMPAFAVGSGGVESIAMWMTDDTANVGTDVVTPGTRRTLSAASQNVWGCLSGKKIIALDAGDTVRFRAERFAGSGLVQLGGADSAAANGSGSVTLQRIG